MITEIYTTTTEEILSDLKEKISNSVHRIGKIYFLVKCLGKEMREIDRLDKIKGMLKIRLGKLKELQNKLNEVCYGKKI